MTKMNTAPKRLGVMIATPEAPTLRDAVEAAQNSEKPAEKPAIKKRLPVMVAVPLRHYKSEKDLPPQIGRMLRELAERSAEHDYTFEFAAACGGLCSARNRLVHEFLFKSDAQILVWRDADLHDQAGKEADHMLRLLANMRENGAHVLGGMYCKREKRPRWVANWINEAKIQAGELLQVAELGMGAKAYSKTALLELRRIFGDEPLKNKETGAQSILYRDRETGEMVAAFHQIAVIDGDLLSEDFFLDWLCRCAKVPIWADTELRLRHLDEPAIVDNTGVEDRPAVWYPAIDAPWPPIPAEHAIG